MSTPSMRVLLVEDSLLDARLLQEHLTRGSLPPLDVIHVMELDEAVARLRSESFDFALLDLSMPGLRGMDTIRNIRSQDPYIHIIGLTAEGEDVTGLEIIGNEVPGVIIEKQNNAQAICRAVHYAIQERRSEHALRESEERFQLVCEASHTMAYDIDVRTGSALFVHGLPTLLGYGPEEMPRNKEWWFAQIHSDDISYVLHQLQAARTKKEDYSIQYRVRHKDGRYIVVEDAGRNLLDEHGRAIRSIGSVVDITQRKQAEDALRQSEHRYHELVEELEKMVEKRTAELEQRSLQLRSLAEELTHAEERERKRLAQVMHDDLQQLLVGAKFCAETLACNLKKEVLREAASRLCQFLNDALECTRSLTFELSPPIPQDMRLAQSLHKLGKLMEAKHGLIVNVQVEEQAEPETEDLRTLLFQVIRELLFNVVKHAQVKTADVEARRLKGNLVQITVSDCGTGFDPEQCGAEDSRRSFGLFNIRGRLDLIGGQLDIQSAPGCGSRCTVTAPLGKFPAAERIGEDREHAPAIPQKSQGMLLAGRKIRVLVADEHSIMRQGLMRLLQEHKDIVVVGEAIDGQETLEMARRLNPDVIILKANMPRLDGIETTMRIREEFPKIKVIGLSAAEEMDKGAAMCKAGAYAFLNKANRPELLVATIRKSFIGAA